MDNLSANAYNLDNLFRKINTTIKIDIKKFEFSSLLIEKKAFARHTQPINNGCVQFYGLFFFKQTQS